MNVYLVIACRFSNEQDITHSNHMAHQEYPLPCMFENAWATPSMGLHIMQESHSKWPTGAFSTNDMVDVVR